MAVLEITEYPERVLNETGDPVGKFDARLARLCEDMFETMYDAEGVGLAARCFQHETDHCDGTLFIHRLSPLKRGMVVKRFQKQKK